MRVIVLDLKTMDAPIIPLADFIAANADDEWLCARVNALHVGDGFTVGGGASPYFAITKIN